MRAKRRTRSQIAQVRHNIAEDEQNNNDADRPLPHHSNWQLPSISEDTSFRKRTSDDALYRSARFLSKPILFVFFFFLFNSLWIFLYSPSGESSATSSSGDIFPGVDPRRRTSNVVPNAFQSPDTPIPKSVLVVIVSNRFAGIVPTVSSILTHTNSTGIELVLIGTAGVNQRVEKHFRTHHRNRADLHSFTSLTLQDIQQDLEAQGIQPIWTWPEWGSSQRDADWFRPEATLHVADWDQLATHAHELNHLRFYLPLFSLFRHHSLLYFIDDDILVRKDVGVIAQQALATLQEDQGMVTPCNIWMWDTKCQTFAFLDEDSIGTILEMPSLYGDRGVCKTSTEQHCYPNGYLEFLHSQLSVDVPHPQEQKAWNFGFTLMELGNWRRLGLTDRYEAVMKESYKKHVFPETSLTFGLGVAYLALAGAVTCWKDSIVAVRDGFGFIEYNRYAEVFGSNFMNTSVDVIHYTGPQKPWAPNTTIDTPSLRPWLNYMEQEGMTTPEQLADNDPKEVFVVLASERAGAEWFISELDKHPSICTSGEHGRPESGYPTDVLLPSGLEWLPRCSIKRSCTLEYIENAVLDLKETMDPRGRTAISPLRCQHQNPSTDPLGDNLGRICNFVRSLNGNITEDTIEELWLSAYRNNDSDLIGCSCPKGTKAKGLKVQMEWLLYENFPGARTGPAPLELRGLNNSKVIRLHRPNVFERYLSTQMAEASGMYHARTKEEKLLQIKKAGNITIVVDSMIAAMKRMEAVDIEGDRWSKTFGSKVLEIDYSRCRGDVASCWKSIHNFLEVEAPSKKQRFNRRTQIYSDQEILKISLDHVTNLDEVRASLAVNSYGKMLVEKGR